MPSFGMINPNIIGAAMDSVLATNADGHATSRGGGTSANGGNTFSNKAESLQWGKTANGNDLTAGNSSASSSALEDLFGNNSSASSSANVDFGWQDVKDYFAGLLKSVGDQNAEAMAFNSAEAEKNRVFQAEQAEIERQWYEGLSGSSYQRAVEDMKKAGINPIMAFSQGGAASAATAVPSGSAASHSPTGGDTLTGLLNSISNLIGSIGSAATGSTSYKKAFDLLKKLLG